MSRTTSNKHYQLANYSFEQTRWRYAAGVVMAALGLSLSACSSPNLAPEPLLVEDLLGTYKLVSY